MLNRTSGIILPKTHPKFHEVESKLNRYVETWDGGSQQIIFYEDLGDSILIPRFYPIGEDVRDDSFDGDDIDIQSKVTPNSVRQAEAIKEFTNRPNGILQLEPGTGKTVIATCIVSHYKKRAIIFAHKDKLLDQWAQEFLTHTTLKPEDIGRLTSANYKECLKKSVILCTPHVVAYAANHDKKEFMDCIRNSGIGVLIVDECHVGVGPEQFSKSSIYVPAKRVYGLSATPSRSDGTDDILSYHLGEIKYFEPESNELLKPLVYMMYMPFGIYKAYSKYFHFGGQFQLARYYTQMHKADKYNRALAGWINKAYNNGRIVLVLGKNIQPLLVLAKKCGLPKEDVGIFIPGAAQPKFRKLVEEVTDTFDLAEAFYKKRVVFSTYGACRDGNNRKDLNFLVMTCPTTNPEQAIGRILRKLEGKPQPIVIDAVDTQGPEVTSNDDGVREKVKWFIRSSRKRLAFYKKKDWQITSYNVQLKDDD